MRQHEEENVRSGFSMGQVFMSFLTGAAFGAVAIFLSAPRSGPETRERIRRLAEESKEKVHRVPEALANATEAATTAFTQAMAETDRHTKRS
jgi:gas vesicle protein